MRITKEIRSKVWKLYYEGIPTGEIAQIVKLPEYKITWILGKD